MKGKLIEPCVTRMMNEENDKEIWKWYALDIISFQISFNQFLTDTRHIFPVKIFLNPD